MAYVSLSEMLHDNGKDQAAADAVQDLLKLVDQKTLENLEVATDRSVGETRARMYYFLACHWQTQGDLAKYRRYLDQAIDCYPGEIDTLIARYRLADQTPEYLQKTKSLIAKAVASMREDLDRSSDETSVSNQANAYNQLAWLIGNTGGDLDEALRLIKKSVELAPDNGAYYDTMGHVYYARGDYENAVKSQTTAAELEPHSGLIVKQLKVFQDALQRKQKPQGK